MFAKGRRLIKDILFPVYCLGCQKEGTWLCSYCLKKIPLQGIFCCPLCHCVTENGKACMWCSQQSPLEQVVAMSAYESKTTIARLLHALKYTYATECLPHVTSLLKSFFQKYEHLFSPIDIIVPIPLHRMRQAERGFNQAELLAECCSTILEIPVEKIGERIKNTEQQAHQSREQRFEQMTDVFTCTADVQGRRVLLVDDVYTTGATMQSCAQAFLDAGAQDVSGFIIARGT